MSRKRIYECLSSILGLPGLEVTDLDILEEALELFFRTSSDFSDTYIAVLSRKVRAESVATFNAKHFKNLPVKLYLSNKSFYISNLVPNKSVISILGMA